MGQDQLTEPGAFLGNIPSQRHQRENGDGAHGGAELWGFNNAAAFRNAGSNLGNDPGKNPGKKILEKLSWKRSWEGS